MEQDNSQLIPHLFRTEHSKMVSVLVKAFGLDSMETAEDIVSETFLSALDIWPYKGTPENPTAWLYTVAKNKLKNHLSRKTTFLKHVAHQSKGQSFSIETAIDFSDKNIADSQLQMLFAICHPSLSKEAQICLALRTLCGLGLNEIADAFLSNKETIHKRLQRAREKLQSEKIRLELPPDTEINERLDTVLQTIYLLFSEGYYSESNNTIVRKELCVEALNLAYLLLDNPSTNTHAANALLSLMCFHASRLDARLSATGDIILLDDQDKTLWDGEFIEKGFYYLQQASRWDITSPYYIEASIAYWHTVDNSNADKWPGILKLYDLLLQINYSPVIALNRLWAFSKVNGSVAAIKESEGLRIKKDQFYFILLAELYKTIDVCKAIEYLTSAAEACKTKAEKELVQRRINKLSETGAN